MLTSLKRRTRLASAAVGVTIPGSRASEPSPIERYLAGGPVPWSGGYLKFKNRVIAATLADPDPMARIAQSAELPPAYGPRLDERVVEYPWVLARLQQGRGRVLDAGSTFSTELVLDLPWIAERDLVIDTLSTDVVRRPNARFAYGDLRALACRDATFEAVACISTLEDVGMAQSFAFSAERPFWNVRPEDGLLALAELRRVLQPGGRLLLTVPYGRREHHGWLRQYDADGIRSLVAAFGGEVLTETYYAYTKRIRATAGSARRPPLPPRRATSTSTRRRRSSPTARRRRVRCAASSWPVDESRQVWVGVVVGQACRAASGGVWRGRRPVQSRYP